MERRLGEQGLLGFWEFYVCSQEISRCKPTEGVHPAFIKWQLFPSRSIDVLFHQECLFNVFNLEVFKQDFTLLRSGINLDLLP